MCNALIVTKKIKFLINRILNLNILNALLVKKLIIFKKILKIVIKAINLAII